MAGSAGITRGYCYGADAWQLMDGMSWQHKNKAKICQKNEKFSGNNP